MFKFCTFIFIISVVASCTKIDTTTLGQNLIPPVDGINTFATDTFTINCENGIFNDTSKSFKTDDQILGNLLPNANFGSTNASIYLQLSPATKFRWLAVKDSIADINAGTTVQGYDSSFICLGITSRSLGNAFYGDSTSTLKFEVYRITTASNFVKDSAYQLTSAPGGVVDDGIKIAEKTIALQDLKKYNVTKIKQFTDSINDQIRIPINTVTGNNWVRNNWLLGDTAKFNDRAAFTTVSNGFIVKVTQGNAAVRVSLSSAATRMEVYYKYRKNGIPDTARQYFYFNPNYNNDWGTAQANFIKRTIGSSAMQAAAAPGVDNLVYLESTPGSFANVKIPYAKNFPNALIHRAELIFEESSSNITPESFLLKNMYLDNIDTGNKVRAVLYDVFPTQPFGGSIDFFYFGGFKRNTGATNYYSFNVTKAFQNLITRNENNLNFRVYAPFYTEYYTTTPRYDYFWNNPNNQNLQFPLINTPVFGRVVLGGGNALTNKVKLKVIYSKI